MESGTNAPCEEKSCSFCCDPVGLVSRYKPDITSITDTTGKQIWKYIGMRPSKKHPDIEKIWLYERLFFNKTTGKCEEYAKRPMICRNTSCIDPTSEESISVQHKKFTSI